MPSIARVKLLKRKYKKHPLSSFQKRISKQTSGSIFADRIEQVRKSKVELHLRKTLYCLLDSNGKNNCNLLPFKIEKFQTHHLLNPQEIGKTHFVKQMK